MVASDRGRLAAVLVGVDAAAVLLFAIEGGALAAAARLDLLGVLVVAVATALGGGTIRDLLLGDSPPDSVRDPRFALVALAGGAATFVFYRYVREIPDPVLITLDAGGLALFAVSGAAKALEHRLAAVMCVAMGGITAVGGGVIRDLLLTRVPIILRLDVYAHRGTGGGGRDGRRHQARRAAQPDDGDRRRGLLRAPAARRVAPLEPADRSGSLISGPAARPPIGPTNPVRLTRWTGCLQQWPRDSTSRSTPAGGSTPDPELSFEEHETSRLIIDRLSATRAADSRHARRPPVRSRR